MITGNKQTNQQVQKTLPGTVQQMDQAQAALQSWPDLMQESRALREDTIALAQLIDFARKDPNLADKNWVAVTLGIKTVKGDYTSIYNKPTYVTLLQSYSDYQSVVDGARRMWNAIEVDLGQSTKSPADRMNVLQAIYNDTTKADILLNVAFLPEYWATNEARYLVTQYKSVTAAAQTKTGKGSPAPSDAPAAPSNAYLKFEREASFQLTSWHGAYKANEHSKAPIPAKASEPQEQLGSTKSDEEVSSYGKAPAWMTSTVNLTRSEYKVDWRNTLLSGLAGAAVGFVLLLLLPAVTRSFVSSPRGKAQLGLLTRSLAFSVDEGEQFAREMGALHLDVLAYLMGDEAVVRDKALAAGFQERSSIEVATPVAGPIYDRIQNLRAKLQQKAI
jgi:hypothetical protein